MLQKNSFDFLRLLFAIFVIVSHSYVLAGTGESDPLARVTEGRVRLSDIGLGGFFAISGFLVMRSLVHSQSVGQYLAKRILRVYPGLVVAVLVTIVVGAIVSSLSPGVYFASAAPWTYVLSKIAMFAPAGGPLPGVFESNPFPGEANGSLWTIPYEFFLYLAIIPLFVLRHRMPALAKAIVVIYAVLLILRFNVMPPLEGVVSISLWPFRTVSSGNLVNFSLFFFGGSVLFLASPWVDANKRWLAAGSVALLLLAGFTSSPQALLPFILPVATISWGLLYSSSLVRFTEWAGDLSYGVYIYAFLIQQTLVSGMRPGPVWLAVASVSLSMVLASLSWRYVEKPALELKRRLAALPVEGHVAP